MGILEKLLNAKVPAGVSSVNGFTEDLTFGALAPIVLSAIDGVFTYRFQLPGQARGAIPMLGVSSTWTALNPGPQNSFVMSNGPGSDLSYTTLGVLSTGLIMTPGTGTLDLRFGFVGEGRGDIPVRGTTGWQRLVAPAVGYNLRGNGAGQVPVWQADLQPAGNIILTAGSNRIRYGTKSVVDSDGIAVEFGNVDFNEAIVQSAERSSLSCNAGYQVTARPLFLSLFDGDIVDPNGGVGHVYLKNVTTVPNAYANGPSFYGEGGRFKSKTSANVVEFMVPTPAARVNAGLHLANANNGATTTQIGKRTVTLGADTFDVLVP